MPSYEDFKFIATNEIVEGIAKSMDPLAFDNPDIEDMEKRRSMVFSRITIAYRQFRDKEVRPSYAADTVQDQDVPW